MGCSLQNGPAKSLHCTDGVLPPKNASSLPFPLVKPHFKPQQAVIKLCWPWHPLVSHSDLQHSHRADFLQQGEQLHTGGSIATQDCPETPLGAGVHMRQRPQDLVLLDDQCWELSTPGSAGVLLTVSSPSVSFGSREILQCTLKAHDGTAGAHNCLGPPLQLNWFS